MVPLVLPTFYPETRLTSLPNSLSSLKPCRTAGKRTGEWPNNVACFSSTPPTPKSCLASASVSAAETEIDGENSVIQLRGELKHELMPKHVAFILDGKGRWAKNRGLTVQHGHKNGRINLKYLVYNCSNLGIKLLSVFAFSSENWKRSKMEVEFLMRTFEDFISSLVEELITRHDIRFSAIGNKSRLPESLQSAISSAEKMSRANKGMHFVMAVSYSGRDDVVEATKNIATKVERGILRATDIDETIFEQELMTNTLEFPNPDLLIRTSGELRISNFLLWQLAYTEFYFADKLFPDFGEDDLLEALESYRCRQRRYGELRN